MSLKKKLTIYLQFYENIYIDDEKRQIHAYNIVLSVIVSERMQRNV